jgi:hypothetical protein
MLIQIAVFEALKACVSDVCLMEYLACGFFLFRDQTPVSFLPFGCCHPQFTRAQDRSGWSILHRTALRLRLRGFVVQVI